jgi:hypothetical protein
MHAPNATKQGLILLIALCVLYGDAFADAPLASPEKHTVCSPAGSICATSDPASRQTVVVAQHRKKTLWTLPGWHRWLFVSDDGESVIVGYAGVNLVPVDVSLNEPVFIFYHRGKRVRTVTLGELYQRKEQMRPTASHYAWTQGASLNKANQLVVTLVNGKTVAFAAKTGKVQTDVLDAR